MSSTATRLRFLDDAAASFFVAAATTTAANVDPGLSCTSCASSLAVAVTGRGLPNNGVDADVAPKGVAFFSVSVAPPPAMLIVSFDSTLAPATAATHRALARSCAALCASSAVRPSRRVGANGTPDETPLKPYDPPNAPRSAAPVVFALFDVLCAEGTCCFLAASTDVNVHSGDRAPHNAHPYARFSLSTPSTKGTGNHPNKAISVAKSTALRRSSGVKSSSRSPRLVSASSACVLASLTNRATRSRSLVSIPHFRLAFAPVFSHHVIAHIGTFPPPRAMAATRAAKSVLVVVGSFAGNILALVEHAVSRHAHPRSCVVASASIISLSTPSIASTSSRMFSHDGYANSASHVSHRSKSFPSKIHPLAAHAGALAPRGFPNHRDGSRNVRRR